MGAALPTTWEFTWNSTAQRACSLYSLLYHSGPKTRLITTSAAAAQKRLRLI